MADDSIWKKELSFKRKPKDETDDAPPAADVEESTSLWKRELSLKKSPEADGAPEAEAVVEETPADEPVTDEPVAAEHVPGTVPDTGPDEPVWKTEVSFARQDADEDGLTQEPAVAEEPVPTADVPGTVPEPGPDETVWKKEVSFGRKPVDAEPALAQEPMTSED